MKKYLITVPTYEIEVFAEDEADAVLSALNEIHAEDLKVSEVKDEYR